MNVAALKIFCAGLRGSQARLYKAPYNILVYHVGADYLGELVRASYRGALDTLSLKKQRAIGG